MKILHINTLQTAGAALCAIRINKALIKEGIDSRMLFAEGETMPKGVTGAIAKRDKSFWYSQPWLLRLKYWLARLPLWSLTDKEKMEVELQRRNRRLAKPLYLHGPISSYKNIAHHPLIEWADIIHLHWVANFIDYPTFFQNVQKPIVWTLHDKHPAAGIRHNCSDFYSLPKPLISLDNYYSKVMRENVQKANLIHIVAISEKMIDICKNSKVLQNLPITLIHNGVDTTIFYPYNKYETRNEFKLPLGKKVFLFSANSLDDENKGLCRVIEALEKVDIQNKLLVCIGDFSTLLQKASFPIIQTGKIHDQTQIAKYYSAADFFIQASYEETFAQAPLEAMACGLPVVSTPCSGASDLIRPFNGILCDGFDSNAIASGINRALSKNYDATAIRQYILDNYRYDIIAKQYMELYESIMLKYHHDAK